MGKFAILSGHYPPRCSGVGDHTCKLARELMRQGYAVGVWTAEAKPRNSDGIRISTFEYPWNLRSLGRIAWDIRRWAPDQVIIQYAPQSIAPRFLGIHPLFPLWILFLRLYLKRPVSIIVHELHYPIEWSIRGALLGVPQAVQFLGLVLFSSHLFFTTESIWSRIFSWLPVGSNIDPIQKSFTPLEKNAFKHKQGISPEKKVLLYFGGLHPTHLLGHLIAAYHLIVNEFGSASVTLVCIGTKMPNIPRLGQVILFEYLSEGEVSEWLLAADLLLAPFMDGVSTRRSTVMAGLAHGLPILTTLGHSSDHSIPWVSFCGVASATDEDGYARLGVKLLLAPFRLHDLGQDGQKFFEAHFEWSISVQSLLSQVI